MADYYVDSSKTGGSDTGADWTNAWTSILSALGVAAGSRVFVAHNHVEGSGINLTLTFTGVDSVTEANAIQVISVTQDSSPPAYQAGAKLDTSSAVCEAKGNLFFFGIDFEAANYFLVRTAGGRSEFANCSFTVTTTSPNYPVFSRVGNASYAGCEATFRNCEFSTPNMSSSSASIFDNICNATFLRVINPTFTDCKAGYLCETYASTSYTGTSRVYVEGGDLSFLATAISKDEQMDVVVRRCKLPTSYSTHPGHTYINGSVLLENCADGNLSAPALGLTAYSCYYGEISSNTSNARNSGASDGETDYSWSMTADNSEETIKFLESPPIIKWIEAGASQTVTVHFASDTALQTDDIFFNCISPDETTGGSDTAQSNHQTSRLDPLEAGGSWTTGDTWGTGSPTYTYKYAFTISPVNAGPVEVVAHACKDGTEIWVCPKLEVA